MRLRNIDSPFLFGVRNNQINRKTNVQNLMDGKQNFTI
jgi:hypothetical protein